MNVQIVKSILILWGIIFLHFTPLASQSSQIKDLYLLYDNEYGVNPVLYNGKKYYPEYPNAYGSPFLNNENDTQAYLYISDTVFKNLNIKYELKQQIFILVYKNSQHGTDYLVLNNSLIDSIKIDGACFVKNSFSAFNQPFVLQVNNDKISAYVAFEKKYFYEQGVQEGYRYSEVLKERFLVYDDQVHKFYNKSSFLKCFDNSIKPKIKRYIKSQKIKMKHISEKQYEQLIQFCNGLI